MVYFFHHYELPAILQQARVQQLLAQNGTANMHSNTTNDVPTDQDAQEGVTPETAVEGNYTGLNSVNQDRDQPLLNGNINTDEVHGVNHHILENHVDAGILNELLEGVEDVRVGGFNIDQQLLNNLEEEIEELQFTNNAVLQAEQDLEVSEQFRHEDVSVEQSEDTGVDLQHSDLSNSHAVQSSDNSNSNKALSDCVPSSGCDQENISEQALAQSMPGCDSSVGHLSQSNKDILGDPSDYYDLERLRSHGAISESSSLDDCRGSQAHDSDDKGTEV